MHDLIISWFAGFPKEWATFLLAMTPVIELRGAIPVAVGAYKMSLASAYFWSVLGNIVPAVAIVYLLKFISEFLSKRYTFWKNFFNWLFERTHRRAKDKIDKYGAWGLFLLVAIPLPMTGGWTGALAAFLFGIEKKKAIPMIILGIMAAGIIVLVISSGLFTI